MSISHCNLLLNSLPMEERSALQSQLEAVPMPQGKVLFEARIAPRYAYLMTSGVASVVSQMSNGDVVEVGVVGREGLPGSCRFLSPKIGFSRCYMQVAGTALRMEWRKFEQLFRAMPALNQRVLEHVQHEMYVLQRISACNRIHMAEARLARWLLMLADRTGTPVLPVTQEFLAQMLGTRRTTITEVAGELQKSGLISQRRGQVTITNEEDLRLTACECYVVTRELLHSLYHDE